MKKIFFLAVTCAIAMFAAVSMTSCNRKPSAPAIPEGTAIGNVEYFIAEDGMVNFIKEKEDNTKETVATNYTSLELDASGFIVATEGEKKALLGINGSFFAYADEYTVAPYFAVATGEEKPDKIVLTTIRFNKNHLAFDIKTHEKLVAVEGIKDEVLPLSNGITLFKKEGLWGFAPAKAETATLDGLKSIAVITVTGKETYYWVSSSDYTGLVDKDGNGIRPMGANAVKSLKKKGKLLWESGEVFAVEVKSL